MLQRHLANENDHEVILCPYQTSKYSYFLNFLTLVMVVIEVADFLLFKALINVTRDDGWSLSVTMRYIHQMAPPYFA